MKRIIFVILVVTIALCADVADGKTVACVGDSITYGYGIENRQYNSYPAQLGRMLKQYDVEWETQNFGVSGTTLLRNGDLPYVEQGAYQNAKSYQPDVVIIKLGTNDSKPQNWVYKEEFVADYCLLIDSFAQLDSKPKIWICKPVPAFNLSSSINGEVIRDEICPLIEQVAELKNVPLIDLYAALQDLPQLYSDGIHPNVEGAGVIAQTITPFITSVRMIPDIAVDGRVNLRDFCKLAQYWKTDETSVDISPPPAGDGKINYKDLAGLFMYWLKSPGLVAHWKLDETEGIVAYDSIGNNHGTLNGDPNWQPDTGKVAGALQFDGIDDYINAQAVLDPTKEPFSAFAWVKDGQPGQVIISQADSAGENSIWLSLAFPDGKLTTGLTDGSRFAKFLMSPDIINDGCWHYVGIVWDGARRYLYVDGKEADKDFRDIGPLRASDTSLYLGAGPTRRADSFWVGLIDDVRIYNRALTSQPE